MFRRSQLQFEYILVININMYNINIYNLQYNQY